MSLSIDIWKSLAGVAIFLLGMKLLEESMGGLASRPFKLFLRKQTSNKLKGVLGGTIVTAALQSSSVINLMILAFVGADVITMQNAMSVILGTNIGTTLNSWIIALVAFKFNIENFAFAITAIAGIGYFLSGKESRYYKWSGFLLGLGFLFLGLDYIKLGMEGLVKTIDFRQYQQSGILIFFLIGLVITSLVQASSVTMAITLGALHANVISLYDAMAIVLGGEVGTTLKLLLASIKGIAAKKRVALGNFIINMVMGLLIIIFLSPVKNLITDLIGIKDNLIALVFFQTFINVISFILFFPFLGLFAKFLESRFKEVGAKTMFIHKVPASETDLAIEALEQESKHFLFAVIDLMSESFDIKPRRHLASLPLRSFNEQYDHLKSLHGEIHAYYILIQKSATHEESIEKQNRLISSVRNGMYAAKNIKDVHYDIRQLSNSSNDIKYNFYLRTQDKIAAFCKQVYEIMSSPNDITNFEKIEGLYKETQQGYTRSLQELYKEGMSKHVNQLEISTLINFNREMYTAYKSLVFALKDYLLEAKQADYFEDLPGFIR